MRTSALAFSLLATALLVPAAVRAADPQGDPKAAASAPANEQVVVPEVDRRDVRLPRFPSKDFEIGAMLGAYSTQSFGTSGVAGVRLGYHITEDFFVESAFAQTKINDKTFKQIFPGGNVLDSDKLNYYSVSAGYNVLPGEVFLGSKYAKASSIYVVGGVGSTKIDNQRHQTFNVGFGFRVLLNDKFALRVDMRDHVFSYDLLGVRQSSQNLELTTGFAFYF